MTTKPQDSQGLVVGGPLSLMSDLSQQPQGRVQPRIRRAQTPDLRASLAALILLAVGILLGWIIFYVLAVVVLALILSPALDGAPDWAFVLAAILGLVGDVIVAMLYSRWRLNRAGRRPFREARLKLLLSDPVAFQRFPHRIVEHALLHRTPSKRLVSSVLRQLEPGVVIFLNGLRLKDGPQPEPNTVPFEPIDLEEDIDRLYWLFWLNVQEQSEASYANAQIDNEEAQRRSDGFLQAARAFVKAYGGLIPLVLLIGAVIVRPRFSMILVLIFSLLPLLSAWLVLLFVERKWWLAPGGLIRREALLWRKEPRVTLHTPEQTPLIVDMRRGIGYLLDAGRTRRFPCEGWIAWVVISGWISRARTPSIDEVVSFAGVSQRTP